MSTIDALPLIQPNFKITQIGPPGYIQFPGEVSPEQVEAIREAWAEAAKEPTKPIVLSGGARFVPFSAYEPQAVLTETIESTTSNVVIALAAATIANTIGVVAVIAALLLQ